MNSYAEQERFYSPRNIKLNDSKLPHPEPFRNLDQNEESSSLRKTWGFEDPGEIGIVNIIKKPSRAVRYTLTETSSISELGSSFTQSSVTQREGDALGNKPK